MKQNKMKLQHWGNLKKKPRKGKLKRNETKLQSWSNFNKKLRKRNRNEMKGNSKAAASLTKAEKEKLKRNEMKLQH